MVLNFLLAQARKFRPRIIFFDKDRGAELFIRAIGGRYDLLRPGAPSGLNPLQLDDTPVNRQFLIDWLALLAGGADIDETARIEDAVDANFGQPVEHRRLRHLAELFRGGQRPHAGDLWARLRPWWGEGERAWLFDNPQDQTDLAAETVGFDMTQILDDPAMRTPAMMYLFHRVEERLDGRPRSSSSTRAGRRSTTTSSSAASRTGRRRSASATASSASPRRARRTRSKAGSRARSSSRPRRRSSWPTPRRAPTIICRASA